MATGTLKKGTRGTVTLEQVSELAEKLSVQDQQKLVEQIHERAAEREHYFKKMADFVKMCLENPIHLSILSNSDEDVYIMRQERGDQLC